jgi:hypothetical protein
MRSLSILGVIAVAGCAESGGGGFFDRLFPAHPVETAAPSPAPAPPIATAPATPDIEAGVKPSRPAVKRASPPGESQAVAALPAPGDLGAQPVKLIGLTQRETVTLLGTPSAQWDRPPAKVWHYQGPGCAVDVFFYLDVSRNEFSALRATDAGADGAAPGASPSTGQSNGQQRLNRIRDVAQHK